MMKVLQLFTYFQYFLIVLIPEFTQKAASVKWFSAVNSFILNLIRLLILRGHKP